MWNLSLERIRGFDPRHSKFQKFISGKCFWGFFKSQSGKNLDSMRVPKFIPQINENGKPINAFGKGQKSVLGSFPFLEYVLGKVIYECGRNCNKYRRCLCRKVSYKGRCEKKSLKKCKEVCRTYDPIQSKYADVLEESVDIQEIRCNVPLEGAKESDYMTDFVCVKSGGDLMVRECLTRNRLTKPLNVKLLDMSRNYWTKRGVADWGIVINAEE